MWQPICQETPDLRLNIVHPKHAQWRCMPNTIGGDGVDNVTGGNCVTNVAGGDCVAKVAGRWHHSHAQVTYPINNQHLAQTNGG